MGRAFASELASIPHTATFARTLPLKDLAIRLTSATEGPVILVGSGGSLTTAEFGLRLFDSAGAVAVVKTPLELLQSKAVLRRSTVLLLSAGGNNKDVLAVFSAARSREAKSIVCLCASTRSKLAKLASTTSRAYTFSFDPPAGRDGYLATNSLLASCILLARAFNMQLPGDEDFSDALQTGRDGFSLLGCKQEPTHYILLHSAWSKPAAVHLESMMTEAGLASSMMADYRHFAHGRHNWLDKQGEHSAIVAFSTPEDEKLAKATTGLLPTTVPAWRCHTKLGGATGGLLLIARTFGFTAGLGKSRGIDPGRPGVPAYGSKIYQLGPRGLTAKHGPPAGIDVLAAVDRKIWAARLSPSRRQPVEQRCAQFVSRLAYAAFGALVSDFDGTILPIQLRNGPVPKKIREGLVSLLEAEIPVFLASGRGDSLWKPLTDAIPERFWPLVHVGYYNGAFSLTLAERDSFDASTPSFQALEELQSKLASDPEFLAVVKLRYKKAQISCQPQTGECVEAMMARLQDQLCRFGDRSLRVVSSSHSIDVIPVSVSKAQCLTLAAQGLAPDLRVLALGDCGAYPGNDFELLQHPYSLSVESVSAGLDCCWNLLPGGLSHTEGTEFYFSRLKIEPGRFHFRP